MAGKQAKVLGEDQIRQLLAYANHGRHSVRDRVMALLSVKAGLRAGEIAQITWPMVLDAERRVGFHIGLHDRIAKKGGGRSRAGRAADSSSSSQYADGLTVKLYEVGATA